MAALAVVLVGVATALVPADRGPGHSGMFDLPQSRCFLMEYPWEGYRLYRLRLFTGPSRTK